MLLHDLKKRVKQSSVYGIAVALLLSSATVLQAQMAGYPAPRVPDYKKAINATVADLMPIARVIARKPSRRMALSPGYGIQPGERALIVVSNQFDRRVLQAIEQAIIELGGKVDIMLTSADAPGRITGNRGYEEIRLMRLLGPRQSTFVRSGGVKGIVQANLDAGGPGYDIVINGSGGPNPRADYRWEYIPWVTADKFMFSMAGFPFEVQNRVDEMLWDTMIHGRTIHATDPEGTDMTWHWQPEFVSMLREHWPGYPMVKAGHLSAIPLFRSPETADANGVLGGTINHTGTYPHIKLTIEKNEIVKVEGGGEYGKRWREVLEDCKEKGIRFPGFPAPGCGWFEEAAIGTDPWRARDLEADIRLRAHSWERGRSGIIHWGLGVTQNFEYHEALTQWYRENSGKTKGGGSHRHIHTHFTTMDFTNEDGKTTRAIDKGRLTFLDDPEVRRIAAKYGDPDEILSEKWIPSFPGINAPGDYMKDYAADPYAYNHPMMEKLRQEVGWSPEIGGQLK